MVIRYGLKKLEVKSTLARKSVQCVLQLLHNLLHLLLKHFSNRCMD